MVKIIGKLKGKKNQGKIWEVQMRKSPKTLSPKSEGCMDEIKLNFETEMFHVYAFVTKQRYFYCKNFTLYN